MNKSEKMYWLLTLISNRARLKRKGYSFLLVTKNEIAEAFGISLRKTSKEIKELLETAGIPYFIVKHKFMSVIPNTYIELSDGSQVEVIGRVGQIWYTEKGKIHNDRVVEVIAC